MQPFRHCMRNPKQIGRFFAKIAVRALYDELSLYPKPGLVSFVDSGAHKDMNGSLLFRSLFGLRHYFYHLGVHAAQGAPPSQLVRLGIQAEKRMYAITQGINTHRGAIFSLGILLSTLCRISIQQESLTLEAVQSAIICFWSEYLKLEHNNENTHGAWVKKHYQIPDAKHLAIEGYSLVFSTYQELAKYQKDKLVFGLLAYQHLLLSIDDINVVYRTGFAGLAFARHHIRHAIIPNQRTRTIESMHTIHSLFSERQISPGGVADMLSFLYFLTYLFKPVRTSYAHKNQTKEAIL